MAEFPLPVLQIWRSRKRVAIQIQSMNIHVSECKYYCLHLVPKFGDMSDRQNWRLHPTDYGADPNPGFHGHCNVYNENMWVARATQSVITVGGSKLCSGPKFQAAASSIVADQNFSGVLKLGMKTLNSKKKTRAALNAEIPSATKIRIWHNIVVLWNSHTVKQSTWWFCLIEIKHYSSRGPITKITLWLCVLHVHWCRDCETVHEQHWNKQRTVSQSQCTPPQCKKIRFGIKNESEVQGQSSPELIGILTVLICICGPDLEILTWIGRE